MANKLRHVWFAVPGDINQKTGGYGYDRRIIDTLRDQGKLVTVVELNGAFPWPDDIARSAAANVLAAMPPGAALVIDGLALPAFAGLLEDRTPRAVVIVLVHHALALESGLTVTEREDLSAIEQATLRHVDGVITTSDATAASLTAYDLQQNAAIVVVPGTDPAPAARGSKGWNVQLLCVAAVIPRKGHLDLITALAGCALLPWSLLCVGSLERDPKTAAALTLKIARYGLGAQVTLAGEVDDETLATAYNNSDIFVLPSALEGYGMAFAEALAYGLPVVGSGNGAVRDTVPDTAGLIVPVGDRDALRKALTRVIMDFKFRAKLAEGSRAAGVRLPDWKNAGRDFGDALDRFASVSL